MWHGTWQGSVVNNKVLLECVKSFEVDGEREEDELGEMRRRSVNEDEGLLKSGKIWQGRISHDGRAQRSQKEKFCTFFNLRHRIINIIAKNVVTFLTFFHFFIYHCETNEENQSNIKLSIQS